MTALLAERPSLRPQSPTQNTDASLVRKASLIQLSQDLTQPGDLSSERFSSLFALAQRVLELDDEDLALLLRVSRPTINRWANGQSAPHPLGRPAALAVLVKECSKRLRMHK